MIAMQETTADNIQQQEKKVFYKRKKLNLKVKQAFQLWLLIRVMGAILFTIGLASIIIYFYSRTVVDTDFLSHALKVRRISEILLPILLAASLTSIVAGLLIALFLPQKIAGPIFRVEQDLQQIREGDLTKKITLRSGDILQELAENVNMTVADMRHLLQEAKESQTKLESKLSDIESEEIKEILRKQKACLGKFKT
jgi:methyl-accepting chemotaxis protein